APLLVGERMAKHDDNALIGGDHSATVRSGPAVPLKVERMPASSIGNVLPIREEMRESNVPHSSILASNTASASSYSSHQASKDSRRRISTAYLTFLTVLVALLVVRSAGFFDYVGGR